MLQSKSKFTLIAVSSPLILFGTGPDFSPINHIPTITPNQNSKMLSLQPMAFSLVSFTTGSVPELFPDDQP
jgi:hypothetical protein